MSACFTHVQSDLDRCCKNGRVNLTQYTFGSLQQHGKLRRGGNLTQYAGNQRRRQAKLHARGERQQPRCRSRMNRRFQRTPRRRPIEHMTPRKLPLGDRKARVTKSGVRRASSLPSLCLLVTLRHTSSREINCAGSPCRPIVPGELSPRDGCPWGMGIFLDFSG
jgi:hypothetical protein